MHKSKKEIAKEFILHVSQDYERMEGFARKYVLKRMKGNQILRYMGPEELKEHAQTALNDSIISCQKAILRNGMKDKNYGGYLHTSLQRQVNRHMQEVERQAIKTRHVSLSTPTDSEDEGDRLTFQVETELAVDADAFQKGEKRMGSELMAFVLNEVRAQFANKEYTIFEYSVKRGWPARKVATISGYSRQQVKQALEDVWAYIQERVASGMREEITELYEFC